MEKAKKLNVLAGGRVVEPPRGKSNIEHSEVEESTFL